MERSTIDLDAIDSTNANTITGSENNTCSTASSSKPNGLKSLLAEMDLNDKKKKKKQNLGNNRNKPGPTKPKFVDFNNDIVGLGKTSTSMISAFKGLTNYGNICYSNVVMQCLISLKEFVNMLNVVFSKIEAEDDIDKTFPILYNLVKIMSFYNSKFNLFMSQYSKKYSIGI